MTGWGNQWIKDHAAAFKAGKSCVLEEYGVPEDGNANMDTWYSSSGLADMFWRFVRPKAVPRVWVIKTNPIYYN